MSSHPKEELYSREKTETAKEHIPKPEPKKEAPKKKKKKKRPDSDDSDDDSPIDITKIIPDDPLFSGKATEGIGNRPEMTTLLQDEEILAKFQDEKTTEYLRAIANDTSRIEEFLDTPEIKFLVTKIKAEFDRTKAERQAAAKLAAERAADPEWGKKVAEQVKKARAERAAAAKEAAEKEAAAGGGAMGGAGPSTSH